MGFQKQLGKWTENSSYTRIEQVDGITKDNDDENYEDEKYSATKFYWERESLRLCTRLSWMLMI